MAILKQPPRIIPKLTSISPFEIYVQQIKGTYDGIRAARLNLSYYPPQFGGFYGQTEVIKEAVVLELIDFQVIE